MTISLRGAGVLVGDSVLDFADTGGAGAVWLRSTPGGTGLAVVLASHTTLGQGQVEVVITAP